jgi:hypothetical protein
LSLELIEKPTALIGPKEALCNFSAHLDMYNPSNLTPKNRDFRLFEILTHRGIFGIFPIFTPRPPQNLFFELVMVTNLFIDRYNSFLTPKNYFH